MSKPKPPEKVDVFHLYASHTIALRVRMRAVLRQTTITNTLEYLLTLGFMVDDEIIKLKTLGADENECKAALSDIINKVAIRERTRQLQVKNDDIIKEVQKQNPYYKKED